MNMYCRTALQEVCELLGIQNSDDAMKKLLKSFFWKSQKDGHNEVLNATEVANVLGRC